MGVQNRTVGEILAGLARSSHGVVTRKQLLGTGVSAEEIERRLCDGSLLREHPGVYRVGHRAPNTEASYHAAVLACGPGALLRGRAAAHLLEILKGSAPPPSVITPTERRVPGLAIRRARRGIDSRDATAWRGIPVTTVARTIVDLAAELSVDELARVCHEAGVRHRTTPAQVEAVLRRYPRAPGAATLRTVLRGEVRVTLSKLERRFLVLLREAGLVLPQTNRVAGGRRVDCRWPELKLTVELDSYTFHQCRHAWEQDRRREREARARGDEFRRYTYGDVFEDPAMMMAELRRLLPLA
jgi:Transcriptional regulator, AbiEi antitoxin